MGAWGAGVFEDDVAADVAATWADAIDGGVAEATLRVYEEFSDAAEDVDDGPVIFFALASLQLDAGTLDERVREAALAAIAPNIERWQEESSPEDAQQRSLILEELRSRIGRFANPS